ncbi:hypothetical protein D9M72_642240 [compost metagenome]
MRPIEPDISPAKAGALFFSSVTMRTATFGPTPGARDTEVLSCRAIAFASSPGVSVDKRASATLEPTP